MNDLEQTVIAVVADHLSLDSALIQRGSSLQRDLGADSVDFAEMVLDLEERLGVTIPDENLRDLMTVADVIARLENALTETEVEARR